MTERVTETDLQLQCESLERVCPAPEGFIWGVEVYAPGRVRYYRFALLDVRRGHSKLWVRVFGNANYTVREAQAFMSGVLNAFWILNQPSEGFRNEMERQVAGHVKYHPDKTEPINGEGVK